MTDNTHVSELEAENRRLKAQVELATTMADRFAQRITELEEQHEVASERATKENAKLRELLTTIRQLFVNNHSYASVVSQIDQVLGEKDKDQIAAEINEPIRQRLNEAAARHLPESVPCPACGGTGTCQKHHGLYHGCESCKGSGVAEAQITEKLMAVQYPPLETSGSWDKAPRATSPTQCPACSGERTIWSYRNGDYRDAFCPTCKGSGSLSPKKEAKADESPEVCEACEVCGDDSCVGPAQHRINLVLAAYRMAHRRGDHEAQPLSLCPLCKEHAP